MSLAVFGMVIVATGGGVMVMKLPSFLKFMTFAGDTGQGDRHQQQGE
ncbi:MAG: hypothetical protein V4640_05395 [Verrucomicrobiota bacterium]